MEAAAAADAEAAAEGTDVEAGGVPNVEAAATTADDATDVSDTESLPGPGKEGKPPKRVKKIKVDESEIKVVEPKKVEPDDEKPSKKQKTPEEFQDIELVIREILTFHKAAQDKLDKKNDDEKIMNDVHFILDQYAVAIFVVTYVITVSCIFLA